MKVEYTAAYPDLYRRHWWWRAREDFLMDVLNSELGSSPSAAILDVGCGAGLFFERLRALGEPYGVESDITMRTGRVELDRRIHWGPLESYRPGRRFDAILFLDVLEHVASPANLLSSALPLLAEGGVVVATVPAHPILWTKHDEVNDHFLRYTKHGFLSVATEAGLRTRVIRYFFHWVAFAKLLVRAVEAVREHDAIPSVPAVPGPLLNRTLYRLSRLEHVLGLERALPFGSSLLYVGTPGDRRGNT